MDPSEPPLRPRPGPAALGGVLVAVGLFVLAMMLFVGDSFDHSVVEAAPPLAATDDGALDTIYEFSSLRRAGDGDEAASPIAEQPEAVALPAVPFSFVSNLASPSARRGANAVEFALSLHNRDLPSDDWVWTDETAEGFPGLIAGSGEAPTLSEFLEWSRVLYRIDMGTCLLDGSGTPAFTLNCPEASWGGPLFNGLTLSELQQPVSFTLRRSAISAVDGSTPASLQSAFERFCEWAYSNRPEAVPLIFEQGCEPMYSHAAAGTLLIVLSGYTADPR